MDKSSSNYAQVFVRVRIPDNLENEIIMVQEELRKIDSSQTYSDPSDLHISVSSFMFEKSKTDQSTYEYLISCIGRIASEFAPFQIRMQGLDFFPTVIYSRVFDHSKDTLGVMKRLIEAELGGVGFVKPIAQGTSYIPHVTILRFSNDERAALLNAINSPFLKNRDYGTGIIQELQIKELNTSNLPNFTLKRIFSSIRKRDVPNKDMIDENQKVKNGIGLTLTRKHA